MFIKLLGIFEKYLTFQDLLNEIQIKRKQIMKVIMFFLMTGKLLDLLIEEV
jgi:hypothetical protein